MIYLVDEAMHRVIPKECQIKKELMNKNTKELRNSIEKDCNVRCDNRPRCLQHIQVQRSKRLVDHFCEEAKSWDMQLFLQWCGDYTSSGKNVDLENLVLIPTPLIVNAQIPEEVNNEYHNCCSYFATVQSACKSVLLP